MISGKIDSIAFGGEGILRHEGFVVFVPYAAPQDFVEVEVVRKKKTHAYGKLKHILEESHHRVQPKCLHFGICGGCQFQHLNYTQQLEAKRLFIQDALERIGGIKTEVPPIVSTDKQWDYRTHITLQLRNLSGTLRCGFIGSDHVTLCSIECCSIFSKLFDIQKIANTLSALRLNPDNQGTLKIFRLKNDLFFLAFNFSNTRPPNITKIAKHLLDDRLISGIAVSSPHETLLFGTSLPPIEYGGMSFEFSPFGFLQNHYEQSQSLYQAAIQSLDTAKCVLDLYCGIGVTSLLLAKQGIRSVGIESHAPTIEIAKKNAYTNKLHDVHFICAKVEHEICSALDTYRPDSILMNPPRTGTSPGIIKAIAEKKIPKIVYVSCMASTLARDLKQFGSHGYRLKSVRGFDLFPQTTHVETLSEIVKN